MVQKLFSVHSFLFFEKTNPMYKTARVLVEQKHKIHYVVYKRALGFIVITIKFASNWSCKLRNASRWKFTSQHIITETPCFCNYTHLKQFF